MQSTPSASRPRIYYLDVAKGLAILLVIGYHVPLYIHMRFGMLPGLYTMIRAAHVFLPFFMPVFFVVSGFFISSKKKYLPFLWSEIRHLILFTLLLQIMNASIQAIGLQNANIFTGFFLQLIRHPFQIIFSQWFVAAIFFARQIYYAMDRLSAFLQKYSSRSLPWLTGAFLLLIACLTVWLEPYAPANNYLYYCQGLVMSLYLYIGQMLKNYQPSMKCYALIGLCYILLYTFCHDLCVPIMVYGMVNADFGLRFYPIYLCLAVSGSILLLWVAQRINRCSPLEFMGRYSLMCYVPQGGILVVSCYWLQHLFTPVTPAQTVLLVVLVAVITLLSLVALSALQAFFQSEIQPRIVDYWHKKRVHDNIS